VHTPKKAAEDVNAAFPSMMSRFEASGLAKAAKEAADRMDALNGPLAKEFGKGLAASSKLLSAYEESGCTKAAKEAADRMDALNGPLVKEFEEASSRRATRSRGALRPSVSGPKRERPDGLPIRRAIL
jgi:hypothetical protein